MCQAGHETILKSVLRSVGEERWRYVEGSASLAMHTNRVSPINVQLESCHQIIHGMLLKLHQYNGRVHVLIRKEINTIS